MTPLHLRAGGVSLVVASQSDGMPYVAHWGADLGALSPADLDDLVLLARPQLMPNTVDEQHPVGLLPEHWTGWAGTPGVTGSRDGAHWSPRFRVVDVRSSVGDAPVAHRAALTLVDDQAGLTVLLEIELLVTGLVRVRAAARNDTESTYRLEALEPALPVPGRADELLDFTGRHIRERSPQRRRLSVGAHQREGRRGRTGTDATLLMVAGEPGFGFRTGEVWGAHVAWSGNHRTRAERSPQGVTLLAGGELLLPGEVALAAGESYRSPWLYGAYGVGLDALAGRIHGYLRSRPHHPRRPRPVTLNTWEAVYFDHDQDRLATLATVAAEVGVERFVLDDGWFHARRDDHAGLGDWWVDPDVWPAGLHPIVEHVQALGMEFGLWVEPEMVNPDSDLAREHPDWILQTGDRLPVESRFQQVLDLGNPDAWQLVLSRLDALLTDYDIAYLKWDHNRDLVDAGSGPRRAPGVHRQTRAFYALVDELRRRHPGIEIESCSSGGGRIDLEVLDRTDRVWTSDCNDPLERQSIQRWTGLLVPPEMLGAHVGPARAHTTGRTHDLSFRAGTALFGHLGVEWDLASATADERRELAGWIAAHKQLRPLLATGAVVHSDHPDPGVWLHGVVAVDRTEGVFAVVAMAQSPTAPPGRIPLPGLDETLTYRVDPLPPGHLPQTPADNRPPWWDSGATVRGSVLAAAGLEVPALDPEHLVLLRVTAV